MEDGRNLYNKNFLLKLFFSIECNFVIIICNLNRFYNKNFIKINIFVKNPNKINLFIIINCFNIKYILLNFNSLSQFSLM